MQIRSLSISSLICILPIYSSFHIKKSLLSVIQMSQRSLSRNREQDFLIGSNHLHVIGVDEAGRGPLAGPVVAAACFIRSTAQLDHISIIDSKATKEDDREIAYNEIIRNKDIVYGVSAISHHEIDEINILQASLKAMRLATEELLTKIPKVNSNEYLALIDGNKIPSNMPVESKFVIKGDSLIYSIAAASIIAKVTRDKIMHNLAKQYPMYKLDQHKGYPTLLHRQLLLEYGASDIHRQSFGPVKLAVEKFKDRKLIIANCNMTESLNVEQVQPIELKQKKEKKRKIEVAINTSTLSTTTNIRRSKRIQEKNK